MTEPSWAICYHTNSPSPRARKWYYVARVVKVDGRWFELYWHPYERALRGTNEKETRKAALAEGLALLHGVFSKASSPRHGSVMVWSLENETNLT